jgi:hypothetical protein
LDYLGVGLQLNFIMAIDLSLSNKEPNDKDSLHFSCKFSSNQYEKCIEAAGSILCPYEADQKFQVLGFNGSDKFFQLKGGSKEEG